ncbi:hypothetical protein H5410_057956 [Solanum commersonii]|uniref:Response regulatory domain-containing protein n=1 Tax=Solanum commersonii TaxID=4109 RepID=A0A9J5WSA4_SOLCO|nr:hypothetical protein H5410_057956 [Solanum commersonii]
MDCEIICNVDIPSAYVGLRILLVDPDTTSLSNIAAILEEHSFKVTAIEQATIALSILREHIDQFDLVMVTIKMIKEAPTQGICYVFKKSLISSLKLKDVCKHVKWHNNKANENSQHYKANQVYVMDKTSCPKKMQDQKEKNITNCSETYQAVDSLIEKDEPKRFKRMRSTIEEAQVKRRAPLEKEVDHSLLLKISSKRPEKKRRNLKWTTELEKKLDEVVRELRDKDGPKNLLERMCKYRSQKQQAPDVEPVTSTNFNKEHHSKVFNSSTLSVNVNELFQGAYIPQPLEVPSVALPSSSDYSLNECDNWINEFLELDDFKLKLSYEGGTSMNFIEERHSNVLNPNVPSTYVGLRILLVDPDKSSLSNIAAILEEHSFKVTAIEQATIALSILREQIDQFDLVMVDANMLEMDYLEFIKSTQLIKDKPIICKIR